ncbi:GAF and ANTAR domain-containing protein [Kutzneria sp. 744]|uniref:GAF and ANTAR domain-containing protein n=1 Tax=Kutzneria sp. (strain 744) TaxID=345341 RepID=UPI0003EED133|nr:GAF and ANTAR domain-containing protein [Kutzneria sp. 744]EWM10729.1 ANTAR domain-containing protein [Kutzneria sp. 744]
MQEGEPCDRIAAEIAAAAGGDAVALRHVCWACAAVLGVDGVSLCVIGDLGAAEPVHATDDVAERVLEAEIVHGCGPMVEAMERNDPVLVPRVATDRRWPMLGPALVEAGAAALFAFPIEAGGVTVGVLELCQRKPGALTVAQVDDAELFAESALELLVDGENDVLSGPLAERWGRVTRSVAVVAGQLGGDPAQAYARLRAHAFATGRRLPDIADDVLVGSLRFRV